MSLDLDRIVSDAVAQQRLPGVVAGVAHGDEVTVGVAGAIAFDGAPMQRDTLFRIASISKPMTAAAVLSLVDEGRLRLDEPVDRLLPELADRQVLRRPDGPLEDTVAAQRPITLRDLLTFTWGFGMQGALFVAEPQWPIHIATIERDLSTFVPPMPDVPPDPDTWLARLSELPLIVQPGERWLYQTGAQVLGILAARAGGTSFDELIRAQLFEPLGMRDTAFWTPDPSRLATQYTGDLKVYDEPDGQWAHPPAFPDGGGGLLSTVDDILAFGAMLRRGGSPVLTAETVAEMTRNQLTAEQRAVWPGFDMLEGRGWGLGLSVLDDGRYSWDGGFGTAWSNVPSLDLTVVVLTQRMWNESGPPAVCGQVLEAAIAEVS